MDAAVIAFVLVALIVGAALGWLLGSKQDRKSTRLNSSHIL